MHPLDRPVWHTLRSGWAALAQGDSQAMRLDPAYGPFAATRDDGPDSLIALASLATDDSEMWLVGQDVAVAPPGMTIARAATLAQMVATTVSHAPAPPYEWIVLGEADAEEMRALALLTRPGPFHPLTHRLGRFIGVRDHGQLVAMAGERMCLPGFTEVSGVCTHPDFRGRGLAAALMRIVMQAMLERGETPFLHAYAAHDRTIALYETLGFAVRAELPMAVLVRRSG
ncbi:GNAT family N-acetyltransferase [Sphingobium terrigena]|uniref:GNAT family N-acetyltransferase n=1 Tax=Sphingobium terrigena TaxID=2304063 RepID=A0A418YTU5_9SPHN|nr:GNAT family N-acetyltransferase [Sphingobium terrigena]RJG55482.1 GNAT family N-acetyltransferase [Sphingobium terrigena]